MLTYPPVPEFHAKCIAIHTYLVSPLSSGRREPEVTCSREDVQIGLLNIQNGVPGVEALVDKGAKVLGQAQIPEGGLELVCHTGDLEGETCSTRLVGDWAAVWVVELMAGCLKGRQTRHWS